jgi:branched-chain amino acid aminotransferase
MRECSDVLALATRSAGVSAARHTHTVKDNHS